jgi:hypothetical protein
MKGMQKISRGKGYRGALNYCFADPHARLLTGGNMSGTTPRELAAEFSVSRKTRDCKKPVWHSSLRLPAGEKLSDKQWNDIAGDYMKEMGFTENHQFCVILHDAHEGQHVHIVASRVGLDGTLFYGQNENLQSTLIIGRLEQKHGLTITRQAQIDEKTGLPSTRTDKKKLKKGEVEKSLRTGFKPPRLVIQDALDKALLTVRTEDELADALQKEGVTMAVKTDDSGKAVGITFEADGVKFGGSKLGDNYRHPAITRKLKENSNDGNRTDQQNGPSRQTPYRPRPSSPSFGAGIKAGAGDRRDQKKPSAPGQSGIGSDAEENRLFLLKTRNRIFSYSKAPLRISRRNYRLWKGRDGRVWLYDQTTGQPAGLAFRDEDQGGKALEVHRPALNDNDAEAVVRLAVESGITGPIKIEGNKEFVQKITAAAHRLGVRVAGDPEPAPEPASDSDEIPFPDLDLDITDPTQPRQRI